MDAPPPGSSIGAWVNEGWQLTLGNIGSAILMMLIPAVPGIIAMVIMAVSGVPAMIAGGAGDAAAAVGAASGVVGGLVALVFLVVVLPALYLGILSCFWDMLQTRRLTFDRIMAGLPMFGSALGLGVIFAAIWVVVGIIAGLIPVLGALVSLVASFPIAAWVALAFYHMAVRQAGPVDSLMFGWNTLLKDPMNLSLMGVVCWLINLAGVLACIVGQLVAQPVVIAAWGACYRDVTGQQVAAPPADMPLPDEPPV